MKGVSLLNYRDLFADDKCFSDIVHLKSKYADSLSISLNEKINLMSIVRIIPRLDIKGIHLEGFRVLDRPEYFTRYY